MPYVILAYTLIQTDIQSPVLRVEEGRRPREAYFQRSEEWGELHDYQMDMVRGRESRGPTGQTWDRGNR